MGFQFFEAMENFAVIAKQQPRCDQVLVKVAYKSSLNFYHYMITLLIIWYY